MMLDYKDKKEKLMYTAVELFAKHGFDGTTTRDICNAAGVNISLISYYFGGKKELYEAIVARFTRDIVAHVTQFVDVNSDLSEYSKEEIIELMFKSAEVLVDFFYRVTPKYTLEFMLSDQQRQESSFQTPPYSFFRKALSVLTGKDEKDREIVLRTAVIIGSAAFPKMMPMFSRNILGRDDFDDQDIMVIKRIIKVTIKNILRSFGIEYDENVKTN